MDPTPIYADLVGTGPRPVAHTAHGAHAAHGEGRPVTDLLRELRDEATRPTRPAGVGRVPGLLTFPSRPGGR